MLFIGKVVKTKVIKIDKTLILVELKDGGVNWIGLVHISNLSDYFVKNINDLVVLNEEIWLKIIEIDEVNHRLKLDYKSVHPKQMRNPFEYEIKESPKGFESLKTWSDNIIEDKNKKEE